MISASINALSRLVFEFKGELALQQKSNELTLSDEISDDLLSELISTSSLFLASKNREIVKSTLGFTKVILTILPPEILKSHLPQIVLGLLNWVHDHKNHFKTKTIHIFERLMRRFGAEEIIALVPMDGSDGGGRKVLEGIKKRKDRAKRKKAAAGDGEDVESCELCSFGSPCSDSVTQC